MTPLQLNCPANINQNGVAGQLTTVNYNTPQVTLNTGSPPYQPVSCNPASGSPFLSGQTTSVSCSVFDSAGATTSCQFLVTVTAVAPGKFLPYKGFLLTLTK